MSGDPVPKGILDAWKDNIVDNRASLLISAWEQMFAQQEEFMELLRVHRGFPEWPVDMTSKAGQQACREAALGSIEEAFESLAHLKNWKKHRASEVKELDKAAFLEEAVDSLHYALEVFILAGISPSEVFHAFMDKGQINKKRIREGY